ncbi:MAG TPA: adenylate/guanylate cyclase domain-containing protein [Myxococcota bacterium]|nr:adenylate/guanylate cyclase domain-containing protein [Myxococcota bacterium]HRY95638.1 adenylate/guanylate cyclase domain-containing protein [Myxococcota bacterium]HSA20337.1 adenylate/guanylate cyclase domain-containing protein [Myxococcota bacterium]
MPYAFRVGSSASLDRLEKLIEERLQPGADQHKIDQRIWDLFGETWAVMFTDLSGFSRKVAEFGIIHFLQVIFESQRLLIPCIDQHDGILLKVEGDSFLVIFRSVAKAIDCSVAMQRLLKQYNQARPEAEHILLCVGLGYGPMLRIGDEDVFGAEVNAASKLGEDIARPWEILVTESVKGGLRASEGISFEPIEEVPPGAKSAHRVRYSF